MSEHLFLILLIDPLNYVFDTDLAVLKFFGVFAFCCAILIWFVVTMVATPYTIICVILLFCFADSDFFYTASLLIYYSVFAIVLLGLLIESARRKL